jgi:Ca2+-binding RTX toxin-like protein
MASNMVKFSPNSSQKDSGNFSVNISEGDLTPGQDVLICGKGLVNNIYGSSYDDIIESGAEASTTIYGCNGNDVLEGTTANDTLQGDGGASTSCPGDDPSDGDDILIGNGNTKISPEVLNGGDGYNRYVPGTGNVTITGGANLDVVFFDKRLKDGTKTNYIVPTSCTRTDCTITDQTSSDSSVTYTMNLTGVEILIFPDQRKDLP